MNAAVISTLGIDVKTADKRRLITRLKGLVSTVRVEDGGVYHEDPAYSLVWVTTHKTEQEMDDWLYKSGLDFIGVFERKMK